MILGLKITNTYNSGQLKAFKSSHNFKIQSTPYTTGNKYPENS